MSALPDLKDFVSQNLLRSQLASEIETDRAGRMAIGLHTAAMMVFALSQFLFFRLTEKADELLDLAGLDLRGGGEFSLLMLAPLGVVAWLLFRVYRRERDRLVLESNLTSAAIETMRRDLLD